MSDQAEALRVLVRRRALAENASGLGAGLVLADLSPPEVGDGSPPSRFWKKLRPPRPRSRVSLGLFAALMMGRRESGSVVD